MNQTDPKIGIIILNYQRPALTLACLESIQAANYPNCLVVVVDNASGDDSVQHIQASGLAHHSIESPVNGGYSAGNNLGLRWCQEQNVDYYWILNNDTTVFPETLTALMQQAQKTPGLVGAMQIDPETQQFVYAGGVINWKKGQTRGLNLSEINAGIKPDYLSGACWFFPKVILEKVGFLEESYFLYAEDIEYCVRVTQAGFPVALAHEATIVHQRGATSGGTQNWKTLYYAIRNRLAFFRKYGPPSVANRLICSLVIQLVKHALKSIVNKPSRARKHRTFLLCKYWALQDYLNGVTGPCLHALS